MSIFENSYYGLLSLTDNFFPPSHKNCPFLQLTKNILVNLWTLFKGKTKEANFYGERSFFGFENKSNNKRNL